MRAPLFFHLRHGRVASGRVVLRRARHLPLWCRPGSARRLPVWCRPGAARHLSSGGTGLALRDASPCGAGVAQVVEPVMLEFMQNLRKVRRPAPPQRSHAWLGTG